MVAGRDAPLVVEDEFLVDSRGRLSEVVETERDERSAERQERDTIDEHRYGQPPGAKNLPPENPARRASRRTAKRGPGGHQKREQEQEVDEKGETQERGEPRSLVEVET